MMNKADIQKIIKKYDKYFVDVNEFKLKLKNAFVDKFYDEGLRSDNIIAIHNESSLFRTEGVVISTLGIHCTYSDFVMFKGLIGVEKYLTSRLYLKYANQKDKVVYICPNGQQEMIFDILQSVVKSKGIHVETKKIIEVNDHNFNDIYEQAKKYYKKRKYKDAYDYFYACASKGHHMSQYYLGEMYEEGFGVKKDLKKALEWYEKSAEQDNALGALYGAEIIRNEKYSDLYDKAIKYYKIAAKQNQVLAMQRLASIYAFGSLCEFDVHEAVFYARKAIEYGNHDCKVYLALAYMKDGFYGSVEEAYDLLYERASNHHDYAKYLIAFYASQKRFDLSKEECEQMMRWANDVKDNYDVDEVIDNLTKMINEFIEAENRRKREEESRQHVLFVEQMYNDACRYEMNHDVDKALSLYEKLILEGHVEAYYRVGRLYWNLGNNPDRAIRLLLDAAGFEHIDAIKMLAHIVEKTTYQIDLDDIKNLYAVCRRCVADGHEELEYALGVFEDYVYLEERWHMNDDEKNAFVLFDNKDYDQAFPLLVQMADEGHLTASEYVGRCYQKGLGTRKNKRLAQAYYKQSFTESSKAYLVEMMLESNEKRLAYQNFIELISEGNEFALKMFIDYLLEHQYELYDEKGRKIVEEYMGMETRVPILEQLQAELDKRSFVAENNFKFGMSMIFINREEARRTLMLAADSNHKEAMLQLFVMYSEDGKYEVANKWYKEYDDRSLLPLPKEGKLITPRCNQCRKCEKSCPAEIIHMNYLGIMSIESEGCIECNACLDECRIDAIKIISNGRLKPL